MPSSVWTLKSLVLFLNAGKRKKKENGLNTGRKTKSLLRRNRKSDEGQFEEIVLSDEIWSMVANFDFLINIYLLILRFVTI